MYIRRAAGVNPREFDPLRSAMGASGGSIFRGRQGGVDPRLDRLFSSLGAEFDAAIDREENAAASDLAFSLLQDREISDVLGHGGWKVMAPAGDVPIDELGLDYVGGGGWIFPTEAQTFRPVERAPSPIRTDRSLQERLRGLARADRDVEIVLSTGTVRGRVVTCGRDHLQVRTRLAETLIPLKLVGAVRLSPED